MHAFAYFKRESIYYYILLSHSGLKNASYSIEKGFNIVWNFTFIDVELETIVNKLIQIFYMIKVVYKMQLMR